MFLFTLSHAFRHCLSEHLKKHIYKKYCFSFLASVSFVGGGWGALKGLDWKLNPLWQSTSDRTVVTFTQRFTFFGSGGESILMRGKLVSQRCVTFFSLFLLTSVMARSFICAKLQQGVTQTQGANTMILLNLHNLSANLTNHQFPGVSQMTAFPVPKHSAIRVCHQTY